MAETLGSVHALRGHAYGLSMPLDDEKLIDQLLKIRFLRAGANVETWASEQFIVQQRKHLPCTLRYIADTVHIVQERKSPTSDTVAEIMRLSNHSSRLAYLATVTNGRAFLDFVQQGFVDGQFKNGMTFDSTA